MSAFIVAGCSRKPETLTSKYDEKKMEQAIADARSTFDEFLARLRSPQSGDEDFHVKVRIEDENGVEHFWVSDPKLDSEPYSGKIADEPGIVKKVKLGQEYRFTRSEVSDWMYMARVKCRATTRSELSWSPCPQRRPLRSRKKSGGDPARIGRLKYGSL
jgi:uncharacterized protein YegJ (DUF2314 family)